MEHTYTRNLVECDLDGKLIEDLLILRDKLGNFSSVANVEEDMNDKLKNINDN